MKNKIKLIAGWIFFSVLIFLSVHLIKNWVRVPIKFFVLFAILGVAVFGYYMKLYWLRNITLLSSLAYLGFYEAGCSCSNGSLETVFMYIGGDKIAKIGVPLFRVAIILAIVYFFGNVFCGWVCPKGAIQEFLFKEKLKVRVPEKLDWGLKKIRYIFLLLIILYPLFYHKRIFNKIDPFKMVFNFTGALYILIFMSIILIASIFVYRPFCRYICPLGALLGIVNKIGIFKVRLPQKSKCICKTKSICESKCPTQTIKRIKGEVAVDYEFCFSCMECESSCPVNKTAIGQ